MTDRTSDDPPEWDAVFWDIGGVVLDLESVGAAHRRFVADLLEERNAETPIDEALETWRSAVGAHFREREGTEFRAAREGYAKGVEAVVGRSVPEDEWRPAFERAIADGIRPIDGAVTAIERLADRDCHQGVVSDVDTREGRRILDEFGVLETFDSITTSEAVGRTKPDPAMFETALESAGVDPERSLMVGDRYDHDAAGAAALGMRTALVDGEDGPAVDYSIASPIEVLAIVEDGKPR